MMRDRPLVFLAVLAGVSIAFFAGGCATPGSLGSQSVQDARIIDQFRLDGRLDDGTFRSAAGVVVLEVVRGGLVLGFTGGHGVAVRRLGDAWSPPLPLDIVAGSIGLQIGAEGGRAVLVFSDTAGFEDFVLGGAQFKAEASGTAWNLKGGAGDPLVPGEVTVVSAFGGLYGGAVLGGFAVDVDSTSMRRAYGVDATPRTVLDGRISERPAGTETLWKALGG